MSMIDQLPVLRLLILTLVEIKVATRVQTFIVKPYSESVTFYVTAERCELLNGVHVGLIAEKRRRRLFSAASVSAQSGC